MAKKKKLKKEKTITKKEKLKVKADKLTNESANRRNMGAELGAIYEEDIKESDYHGKLHNKK